MAEIVATSGPVTADTDPKKDKSRAFSWVKGLLYKAPPEEPEVWKTYNPGTFKVDNGIGVTIDTAGRPENIVHPADKMEKVSVPVHENYTRFLTSHMSDLIRNVNDDPVGFLAILNSPEHQYEKKLLERICDPEVDPKDEKPNPATDGKRYRLNETKLAEFLATPAGLEATTMLLEQQATYEMFGTGLTMALDPKGYRELNLQEGQTQLGVDEGPIADFVDTRIMPYLNTMLPDIAGRPGRISGMPRDRQIARGWVISYLAG